ncbi:MAG: FumA C-terminus/TtdB family hydratase beta subunit [Methanobacteriota archaeon]
MKKITTPMKKEGVKGLKVGDTVYLSGEILTARDKAHKRIIEYAKVGEQLPFTLERGVIYHTGPLTRKNPDDSWNILSAGPTTSARMNDFTPRVIEEYKVRAIIGKGGMSDEVVKAMEDFGCIYLAYTGGAGALAAEKIEKVLDVHWLDLSAPEAVWQLQVKDFGPLTVAIDSHGGNLYKR